VYKMSARFGTLTITEIVIMLLLLKGITWFLSIDILISINKQKTHNN